MYKIDINFSKSKTDSTVSAILYCTECDAGDDTYILEDDNGIYCYNCLLGPYGTESLLINDINRAIKKAKDYVSIRRINNYERYSVIF